MVLNFVYLFREGEEKNAGCTIQCKIVPYNQKWLNLLKILLIQKNADLKGKKKEKKKNSGP